METTAGPSSRPSRAPEAPSQAGAGDGSPRRRDSIAGLALYPILAAVYPALRVAASNAFDVPVGELAAIAALCAVAGLVINGVAFVLLRRRLTSHAAALVGLILVASVFDVESVADSAQAIGLRSRDALIPLTLGILAGIGWLLRTRRDLRAASRFASVALVVLTALATVQFVARKASIARALGRSAFLARLTAPLPAPAQPVVAPRRDVYVLILDNYANAGVLAERFHFDNAPFADSLRALGFTVPRATRSNYGWTPLSVGSILAGAHLNALERDPDARDAPWDALYAVIRRSRVLAAFARAGYEVFVVKSAYFFATQGSDVGQSYASKETRSALMRLGRVNLGRAVLDVTLPGRLLEKARWQWMPKAVQLAPFDGIVELAASRGPKVVIAHSLIAHNPFVLDARCNRLRADPDGPEMYVLQIRCTNAQVLRAMHAILAANPDPVILIFGDHGPMSAGLGAGIPAEAITRDQAFERFGAFRATRLPAGMTVPDSATPVNVMTRVVHSLLGIEIPIAADSSYWSTLEAVDHFVSVDSLLRRQEP